MRLTFKMAISRAICFGIRSLLARNNRLPLLQVSLVHSVSSFLTKSLLSGERTFSCYQFRLSLLNINYLFISMAELYFAFSPLIY